MVICWEEFDAPGVLKNSFGINKRVETIYTRVKTLCNMVFFQNSLRILMRTTVWFRVLSVLLSQLLPNENIFWGTNPKSCLGNFFLQTGQSSNLLEPENSFIPQQATSEAHKGGKIVLKEGKQFLTLASIGWISELLRNSRRSSLQWKWRNPRKIEILRIELSLCYG